MGVLILTKCRFLQFKLNFGCWIWLFLVISLKPPKSQMFKFYMYLILTSVLSKLNNYSRYQYQMRSYFIFPWFGNCFLTQVLGVPHNNWCHNWETLKEIKVPLPSKALWKRDTSHISWRLNWKALKSVLTKSKSLNNEG